MNPKRILFPALALAAAILLLRALPFHARAQMGGPATVHGIVIDDNGPVAGATVRIQATANRTLSAADGTFTLTGLPEGAPVTVSAWKEAYYCAKVEGAVPPAEGITLILRRYQTDDNPAYTWVPPTGPDSCFSCKPGLTQIWLDNDAHARSGSNPRFLSLYNGTDLSGEQAVAPGYQQDFPGTAGNCATCHAPAAALAAPFATAMNALPALDRDFGIHCDFCHKVADVYLDPATGLPYPTTPGVLAMDVRRPFPGTERYQLFFGTFDDDNVPEEDTKLPLLEKSQWCAPCHQFSFWGTPIYQSFDEWLKSPYAQNGVECQVCHMPSDGVMTNVAPGRGGVERDPQTIHAHTMPGAKSVELLQNTVTLSLDLTAGVDAVVANVRLVNSGAGHHVPTDHPGRHMILVVRAYDSAGQPLPLRSGPQVPEWGGPQSGLPGKAYAKILRDVQTGAAPVVSYWKQTLIVSDNRLPALAAENIYFAFEPPAAGGPVRVTAELLFRRAFQDLMDSKAWNEPDILMESQESSLTATPYHRLYLPLAR